MNGSAESLAALRGVRLPDGANPLADACAGFVIGLVAALVLFALLRAVFTRAASRRELALAELRESRDLEPGERLLRQATLVNRILGEPDFRPAASPGGPGPRVEGWLRLRSELRDVLYRPEPAVDLDALDNAIAGLIRRMRS